jgi:hypothetical protein
MFFYIEFYFFKNQKIKNNFILKMKRIFKFLEKKEKKEKKGGKDKKDIKKKPRAIGKISDLFNIGAKPTKPTKPAKPVKPVKVSETDTPQNTPQNSNSSEEKGKIESKDVGKKGILIGLNYPNSHYSLNGCVNDVKNGDTFLKAHGYESRFLADEDVSDRYDVLEALEELKNSNSKFLFFHYSGHGTQVDDKDKDELDGKDETVYSKNGHMITDDEINAKLAQFSADKVVVLVFDCCHSGTIADLPYIATAYDPGVKVEKVKKDIKAKVICVSGCRDSQTSADITERGLSYGALSSTLYSILRKNEAEKKVVTWRQLYDILLVEMTKKRYAQIPQLTASDASLFNQPVQF